MSGSEFRVWGLGFIPVLDFGSSFGFRVSGVFGVKGFRGLGFTIYGAGFIEGSYSGFWVSGL